VSGIVCRNITPSCTSGVGMLVPARSGARHAGLRFWTFCRVMTFNGLKFWPSYVRPHCNQSAAGGFWSMRPVTVLRRFNSADVPGDPTTGASGSNSVPARRGMVSAASASMLEGSALAAGSWPLACRR
jgi:hypothetical protein